MKKTRLENLAIDQKMESINKIIQQAPEKVVPRKEKISFVNKDFTSKAKDFTLKAKAKDLTLTANANTKDLAFKTKVEANDFKTVLKDSLRTRPRTNNTGIV